MVPHTTSITFILIKLFIVLFNKANCKSGGGHYSSQRTLSGPSGHGSSGGNQQQNSMYWGNSLFPQDTNAWYDYGK
jgi:hypothetical protein